MAAGLRRSLRLLVLPVLPFALPGFAQNGPERLADHGAAVAHVRTPATAQADLAVTKTGPSAAATGAPITFTLTAQNLGPSDATNVLVTDVLPAAVSFETCTADMGGVCGGTGSARTVAFPTLASGATATIVLTGTVLCGTAPGTITNNASISAASPPDPNPANDQSHADVLVVLLPPPPPALIPIDTLPVAGALSPGRVASAPPSNVYTWTITNGTITDGQGTNRITFTAGTPGPLTLRVSAPIAGTCFSYLGFANVDVLPEGSAILFHPVPPCRVADTRGPAGPLSGPALAPGETRTWTVAGVCGIPAAVASLALNASVVSPAATGELAVYAGDAPLPATRNLSFDAGVTRAAGSVVKLAGDGSGTIRVTNLSAGTVDVVLDVSGIFQ